MLQTSKNLAVGAVCLVVVVCVTCVVVLITRASSDSLSPAAQTSAASRQVNKGRRNLSLQPEAFRVARQLGQRFGAASRAVSTSSGQLSVAGTEQSVILTRRQAEVGKRSS
jgi:hypothetical protein